MKVIPEAKRERGERRPLYFKPRSFRQRPQVVESRGRIGQLQNRRTRSRLVSRALFGRDDGESGPALLHVLTPAVRTLYLTSFVVDEGQYL